MYMYIYRIYIVVFTYERESRLVSLLYNICMYIHLYTCTQICIPTSLSMYVHVYS